jgi:hypothetical protein
MAGSLTPEQVRSYERDGYLLPVGVFDVDEVAAFRADFEAFEHRWSDAPGLARPFVQYVRDGMQVICPAADRIARHPAVLDVVESVIGPDLMVWTCEMLVKEPHSPQMLTMHQDHRYWGFGSSGEQVTAWIALSEVTDANGAMRFVRGSHLFGDVDHHDTFGADNVLSRGQEITIGHDPADEVVVALHPGELSLHHGLMFHGSGPNGSDVRRVGIAIRYVTPSVRQEIGGVDYATPVRGDCSGAEFLTLPVPVTDFDPETVPFHERMLAAHDTTLGTGAGQPMAYDRGRSTGSEGSGKSTTT